LAPFQLDLSHIKKSINYWQTKVLYHSHSSSCDKICEVIKCQLAKKEIIFPSTLKVCFLNLNAMASEVTHQIGHHLHHFSLEGKIPEKSKIERNDFNSLSL